MGMLIDGQWVANEHDVRKQSGKFSRADAQFREFVSADGGAEFPAEAGRYHLYVSNACPWAHRTLIVRRLKKLDDAISVSYVAPLMLERGWELPAGADPINQASAMYEVYQRACRDYTGRCSVPVLWDKARGTVVSNESSEIIRMFNSAFDAFGAADLDLYPAPLRAEIDAVNDVVYNAINNGVYKCGFASAQAAYEEAVTALFGALDAMEERLDRQPFLVGARMTEADWRLFTTLVRFDAVYHGHFKCNLKRIIDYPNLANYLRALFQMPGVAETVHIEECKAHYYGSHRGVNPTGVVAAGPDLGLDLAHDRGRLR